MFGYCVVVVVVSPGFSTHVWRSIQMLYSVIFSSSTNCVWFIEIRLRLVWAAVTCVRIS